VSGKTVILRLAAERDFETAVDYYLSNASEHTAHRFADAIKDAYGKIPNYPGAGSPRYSHELSIEGLKTWKVERFPYLIFYFEHDDYIDVWRILHGRSDIPAWLVGHHARR
jgi:toxin ParE1/3/4